MQVWHQPLNGFSADRLEQCFEKLTNGRPGLPDSITVNGREVRVRSAAEGVARFSFAELCERPLGASDYLALATHYHTLVVSDIPCLSPDKRDAAKRFVTLVDALYEHKVTLIASAEAPPETLYPSGDGAFEFQRTVSRLMEMQSEDYVEREHLT
jgi:cell division protein ZapE